MREVEINPRRRFGSAVERRRRDSRRKFFGRLTGSERSALKLYTKDSYAPINKYLRTGEGTPGIKRLGDTIKRVLDKAPKNPETLYRGLQLGRTDKLFQALQSAKPGDRMKIGGSASRSYGTAKAFTGLRENVVLSIRAKNGVDLGSISGRIESEVLLSPASDYKFKGKEQVRVKGLYDSTIETVYSFEEVRSRGAAGGAKGKLGGKSGGGGGGQAVEEVGGRWHRETAYTT